LTRAAPREVLSLCDRRAQVRRDRTVAELLRGECGEDWAIRYLLAELRIDAARLAGRGPR